MRQYIFPIILLFVSFFDLQSQSVLPGIDILLAKDYDILKDKRIALLANNASRSKDGTLTAELMSRSKVFKLVSILTPEHGFFTDVPAGKTVSDDTLYSVPVYSLYGKYRRPTAKHLSNCDAVVVDIQDIGIRSYTFISTVYKVMDAAAEFGKEVIIIDRPNPIGGLIVDGNSVDSGKTSFVSQIPVAYIHGCTVGELAYLINEEGWLGKDSKGIPRKCKLSIVKMQNWKRSMEWEQTGLNWSATSPNIPNVNAVRGAAMFGAFGELGKFYLGIGTPLAFQCLGMQEKKIDQLQNVMGSLNFDGVQLIKSTLGTGKGKSAGKKISGFNLKFTPNPNFKPYTTGIKIMLGIRKIYPDEFIKKGLTKNGKEMFEKVTGTNDLLDSFLYKDDAAVLKAGEKGLQDFLNIRKKYLLYD